MNEMTVQPTVTLPALQVSLDGLGAVVRDVREQENVRHGSTMAPTIVGMQAFSKTLEIL